MHVFSAPKPWSLLFAPCCCCCCCWFIILLFLSCWSIGGHSLNVLLSDFRFEWREKRKNEETSFYKIVFFSFLPVCASRDFLSLVDPVREEKKFDTYVWRRDGLPLIRVPPGFLDAFLQQRVLQQRSFWEELNLVLDSTNEESSLTRASSALHSRTPIRSCESTRFPSLFCVCSGSRKENLAGWIGKI